MECRTNTLEEFIENSKKIWDEHPAGVIAYVHNKQAAEELLEVIKEEYPNMPITFHWDEHHTLRNN